MKSRFLIREVAPGEIENQIFSGFMYIDKNGGKINDF
jgi:hypothetical protein